MPEKMGNVVTYESPDGKFKVSMWEEDGIVRSTPEGLMDKESAIKEQELQQDFRSKIGSKYLYLSEINELQETSPQARNIIKEHVFGKTSCFEKIAIVGGNFVMRTMSNMYAKISSVPMRLFKTKEEAEKWLRG